MNKKILFFIFNLFFVSNEILCQQLFPRFRFYTSDDGLFGNMIHYITQDDQGYMWFAAYNGISRFDSYKFMNYKKIDNSDSIPTRITSINKIKGELWLSSSGYIYKYNYLNKSFERFNNKLESLGYISTLVSDDNNKIWIVSDEKGLYELDIKNKTLTSHKELSNIKKILAHQNHDIYALTSLGAIYLLNKNTNKFEEIYNLKLTDGGIMSATLDKHGNIWIGDWVNGIYCFRQSNNDHIHYTLTNRNLPIKRIHTILEYDHKHIVVGSDEGLTFIEKNTGTHFTIDDDERKHKSLVLNNRFVYTLWKDREDNIWAGTYFGGVSFLGANKNNFNTLPKEIGHTINMGRVISKFNEDHRGVIWIGTDDGGLYEFNPKSKSSQRIMIGGNNEPLNIHALYCQGNSVYVGTYQSGLYEYNFETKQTVYIPELSNVYSLEGDNDGNIWLGNPSGLFVKEKNKNNFIKISKNSEFSFIDQLVKDNNNRIWIKSNNRGLSSVDIKTKKIIHYDHILKPTVPNNMDIKDIHYLNNKIWLGVNDKGIISLDLNTWTLNNNIISSEQIKNSQIQFITSSSNMLWIGTITGLFLYNLDSKKINYFNKDDGLETEKFNPQSGYKTKDGSIYIGGYRGFNYFSSDKIVDQDIYSPVRITDFHLTNKKANEIDPSLDKHITLKHNQTIFKIDFSSMYYSSPSKIKYRYILDGFDEDFIETDKSSATYTNVPPGDYTFKVVSNNSFDSWAENYATIKITILPPWWRSAYMHFIYFLLFLLAIIAYIYNQRLLLKKKNEKEILKLKQENEQKIIESKLEFFANIAHEIRTPATLISAPIEFILDSSNLPSEIMEDMQIIKKNSNKLIELINQVLDFRNIDYGFGQINYTKINICDLIADQLVQYKKYCENHKIQLRLFDSNNEIKTGIIDKNILSKIFNSLMSNALKYTNDLIEIILDINTDILIISIYDNGKGIPLCNYNKIFEPFFTTSNLDSPSKGFGIGLSMVAKLLETINGKIEIDSEVNLYTRFTVTIPFGNKTDFDTNEIHLLESNYYISTLIEKEQLDDETFHLLKDNLIETILVVEDDEELANYLAQQIGKRYNVKKANSGSKAFEILSSNKIDLIVSDVSMNELDGFELCKKIKENIKLSHIPIILLTGQTDNHSKIKGINSGADVYLVKPISISFLYAQINGMLEKRKQLIASLNNNPQTILQSIVDNEEDKKFISRIEEIIIDNLSNTEFSVDNLARQMYVSRSSLYAKVNAISDLTPNEFIRLIRLRKAAHYITEGKYKINEICYLVGFSSPSYFTRCFTKQFDVSPKDYRPI